MDTHEGKGIHNLLTLSPTHKPLPSLTNPSMQPYDYTNYNFSLPNALQNPEPASSNLFNRFLSNSLIHVPLPLHIFSPNTSSLNADFTPNEPNNSDYQLGISHEKRLKRMISNRESARRSRMRKKKQIEELQYQVSQLQTMNNQLSEKVIHLLGSNHEVIQENSQLKERVSFLQVVLSDLLIPLRNAEESACNTNNLIR